MIEPINNNLNIKTSSNLEPVEVPHFTGLTKISGKAEVDTFVRSKKIAAPKNDAQTPFEAVKKGAKDGVMVITDAAKKGVEFTKEFAGSMYNDITGIARQKGVQTITNLDGII